MPTSKKQPVPASQVPRRPARYVPVNVEEGEYHLAVMAEDPLPFIKTRPKVPRGAARRTINTDLEADLGAWMVQWCTDNDVSQRELFNALVSALMHDVEGTDKHPRTED